MELFKNRPMAAVAAIFVIVSIVVSPLNSAVKLAVSFLSTGILLVFCAFSALAKGEGRIRLRKRAPTVILCIIASVFAALNLYFRTDCSETALSDLYGVEGGIEGKVEDVIYENSYSGAYVVKVSSVNGVKREFKLKLETGFAADLATGDLICAEAEFSKLTKDGSFDEEAYYKPKGVLIGAEAATLEVIGASEDIFTSISELRMKIASMLEIAAEEAGGDYGMTAALLIGDRNGLNKTVSRDFNYTGASHLLAVSGAHFTILLGGIEMILKKLTVHKTPRTLILMALVIFYMALTGFSASVLRAGLMLLIYHLSHFARREPDGVTSLFTAVAAIFIFSPFSAEDVGLLLSFAAMLACIITSSIGMPVWLSELLSSLSSKGTVRKLIARAVRSIYMNAFVGISVIIMTLPIMWMVFGRVSVLSPLSTLILNLPVTAVLYLSPFVVITFRIPWLCRLFSYPCSFFCRLSVWLVRLLSKTDGAELALPSSGAFTTVFCTIIVICVIAITSFRKRTAIVSSVVLFLCIAALFAGITVHKATYDKNSVTYINSAKNDGFAVTDGTRSLVCDISTGGWNTTSTAVEEVKNKYSSRINVYMLTHLHARHTKTAAKLFEREYVDEIWLPSPMLEGDAEIIGEIKDLAEKNGVAVVIYDRGTELTFGDIKIDTAAAIIKRSTHPVLALSFESEGERVTYLSSSVHESDVFDHALDMCSVSDKVFFGAHGPVIKSGADYGLRADVLVVFANPEVAERLIDLNPVNDWNVYE